MRKSVRLSLVFSLFLLLSTTIWAQASEWYTDKPIASVEFQGLERVKVKDLEVIVKPFFTKPLTEPILADIQRRLLETDFFESVDVEAKEGADGKESVILVFQVAERPVINKIRVEGNSAVRQADIIEVVKLKAGDFVSKPKAAEGVQKVRQMYIDKGFAQVKVDFKIEAPEGVKGLQDIVYVVSEGNLTTVQAVRFSGNTYVAEATLKGLLKTAEQGLFNTGTYLEANVQLDTEKILTYYRENGYVDIKILDTLKTEELDPKEQRKKLTITYVLDEGQQYTFSGYSIEGNSLFSTKDLLAKTKSTAKNILNLTKVQSDTASIRETYFNQGYALNEWGIKENRDVEKRTIGYTMQILERGVVYIGEINIRGNVKTKREIIDRELPFKVGDVFSMQKLRMGYMALMNTRYFSNVIPEPVILPNTNVMQIIITLEEQNTTDVRVGLSVSGDESLPIAFIGKYSDNNFLGYGTTFGADLSISGREQSIGANYSDNWLFGEDLGGGINLTVSRMDQKAIDLLDDPDAPGGPDSGYGTSTIDYTKWNILLGINVRKMWRTSIGRFSIAPGIGTQLNHIWYDVAQGVPQDDSLANNLDKFVFINYLSLNIALDGRDLAHDPSNGYYIGQNIKMYGGFLFGARDYISTETTIQGWLTLWDVPLWEGFNLKTVIGINSSLNLLWPQFWTASGNNMNMGENRLRINSMLLARGWSNWASTLNMENGGDALWNNWIELRTPLVQGVLSLDFFFDAVRLTSSREDIFSAGGTGWLFGFGGGLRLAMQGLPLRLYLGKRFSLDDNSNVKWQRGSIGASSATSDDGLDLILAISIF